MRNSRLSQILSAAFQTILPQVLGVLLFYYISKQVSKEVFGVFSWCNAVAYFLVVVASLGLEQVVFRRLAAGSGSVTWTARFVVLQSFFTSIVLMGILGLVAFLFPHTYEAQLMPLFFAGQALLWMAVPPRLLLNVQKRYLGYGLSSLAGNALKMGIVAVLSYNNHLNIYTIAIALLLGNVLEWGGATLLARNLYHKREGVRRRAAKLLIRESLPQYVAVLFDALLARIDWILLGILLTNSAVAEYSFAYRAFEAERIPTVTVGAIMLPLAARWLAGGKVPEVQIKERVQSLMLLIPAAASCIAVAATALWPHAIGGVMKSEYGLASWVPFALLNAALMMQFAINLLWTQVFAGRQYAVIIRITALTAFINLGANFILIPLLGTPGAAVAFVAASGFQMACYVRRAGILGFVFPHKKFIFTFFFSLLFLGGILGLPMPALLQIMLGVLVYPLLLLATGILTPKQFRLALQNR